MSTEQAEMADEDIVKLLRDEMFKAYEAGAKEGWQQGYAAGVTNVPSVVRADIEQARRDGGAEERKTILNWIDLHARKYHSASEASKFAKKFRQFVESRPRFDA